MTNEKSQRERLIEMIENPLPDAVGVKYLADETPSEQADRILALLTEIMDKSYNLVYDRETISQPEPPEMGLIETSDRLSARVRALAIENNIFSGMLLTLLKSPSDLPPDDYRQIQALARIAWSDSSIKVRKWLLHTYSDWTNVAILTIVNVSWYRLIHNEQTTVLTAVTKMVLDIMGKLPNVSEQKELGILLESKVGGIDEFNDWSEQGLRSFREKILPIIREHCQELKKGD